MGVLLLLAVINTPALQAPDMAAAGVVVEEVRPGCAGDLAGLRVGDVLLSWSPRASSGDPVAGHPIASPLDLRELEVEYLPRGPVTVEGRRADAPFTAQVAPDAFGLWITARPAFPPSLLDAYERGRSLVKSGQTAEGTDLWRQVAAGADAADRCWLLGRAGWVWAEARNPGAASRLFQESVDCAQRLPPLQRAATLEQRATNAVYFGRPLEAGEAYRTSLDIRRAAGAGPLTRGTCLLGLAEIAVSRGQEDEGRELYRQAIAVMEGEAPQSLALAWALTSLATHLAAVGEQDGSGELYARALKIAETIPPEGPTIAGILSGLGGLEAERADFQAAEEYQQRVLEIHRRLSPDSKEIAIDLLNLGMIAARRGDLEAAERRFRESASRAESQPGLAAMVLQNLANLADARGDWAEAEGLRRRSLATFEALAPGSLGAAAIRIGLAETLRLRGDRIGARDSLARAMAIIEKLAPEGATMADALLESGRLAAAEGDWAGAEGFYARASSIRERLSRASAALAEALHGLGVAQRALGRRQEATMTFAHALEALEAQWGRVGGSDEARVGFGSAHSALYQEPIDLLIELGREAEALQLLERSRARSFLVLVAERDLIRTRLPPELAKRRRKADAEYDRVQSELLRLDASRDAAEVERLQGRLLDLRTEQQRVVDEIRQTSSRMATLRYPQALDLAGVQAALDPGTLLLTYSVGSDDTQLFAVRSGSAGQPTLRVSRIAIGREALRARIQAFRQRIGQSVPEKALAREAADLYELLVRPVDHQLAAADRVLISPDGPLHILPFAALRRDGRYLVEWKPVHTVASATVYAELRKAPPGGPPGGGLMAFGDPRYPAAVGSTGRVVDAALREEVQRGLSLKPLPGSRQEVEAIARLYPRGARVFLGERATEELAKSESHQARYLHFACHSFLDEHQPLNSGLALTIREQPAVGQDNGLLQAWEILEQVQLAADLVTLSACDSGGKDMGGEGLVGLTRAFQYAGARSVVASLWSVSDRSAAALMRRFYDGLRLGLPKDKALQRAQVSFIRGGSARSHPFRWAAFQLFGDWE